MPKKPFIAHFATSFPPIIDSPLSTKLPTKKTGKTKVAPPKAEASAIPEFVFDTDTNYADGSTLDYTESEVSVETLSKISNYYLK